MVLSKKWSVPPWDQVSAAQRWDTAAVSGVMRWSLRGIPPPTCTRMRRDIHQGLAGAALDRIIKWGADPGPAPTSGNLPGTDVRS